MGALKAATEAELKSQQAILSKEEASRVELAAEVKAHSGSIGVVKKEDEVINKLNKEKKHIAETQAKSNDDMVSVNEKVEHLASIKSKLESTLGELEGGLDKEKKSRATLEKQKR